MQQLPKDTSFEALLAWAQSGGQSPITAKQKEQHERLVTAHNLFLRYGINEKVVKTLMTTYKYSEATAYRDLSDAKRFFGSSFAMDKQYARVYIVNKTIEALARAKACKDVKAEASLLKVLYLAWGLDKDDYEMPDWKNFTQMNIMIVTDPKAIGLEPVSDEDIEKLRRKYLSKRRQLEIEEAKEDE